MNVATSSEPLPRELAPGIFWCGQCMKIPYEGREVHAYNSAYLIVGEQHSAIVETGITFQHHAIMTQLEQLSRDHDMPDPRHVFVTHSEMAHAGGVGGLLARYPNATARGDVSDLHLVYPRYADRMAFAEPGDRFDLGGTEIIVVESVFRDLAYSRWYFDTRRRVLFPGDGFAYEHYHEDGACGQLAEEAATVDITSNMGRFALLAFHWTQFVDIEPYVQRLDQLIFDELHAELIAPTHGLPLGNPTASMPRVRAGFRGMRDVALAAAGSDIEFG